ncbi:hypothetical protein SEA_DECURRO_5 [Arthrobacter phage Decurro]|uniref:Uncharacterized protein n=2 Tax=Decurrovirus decurro TaxID=1982105 RepID=A0A0U4IZ82_9CAUD|nr:hypothetical protein SEA_DECURRO_5 [Arthrobacter phage Decurro]ALF00672.1 hypothetical protein SEA_DECURRO_5 [Arthrobacter phage Decurro]ALY10903.1 hypothetical protein YANK_5 [Arthrobacter phage Yank]
MIRLDKTQFSIVVLCTLCPTWRALHNDKALALAAGRQHNLTAHEGEDNTLSAARQQAYRARKAAAGA